MIQQGQQWRFEQDEQSQWRWTHIDAAEGEIGSPEAFPTQIDCMLDAVRFTVRRSRGGRGDQRLQ